MVRGPYCLEGILYRSERLVYKPDGLLFRTDGILHRPEDLLYRPRSLLHRPEDLQYQLESLLYRPKSTPALYTPATSFTGQGLSNDFGYDFYFRRCLILEVEKSAGFQQDLVPLLL